MEILGNKYGVRLFRSIGVLVMAAVCYLSFSPSLVKVVDIPYIDKAEHSVAYLVLTLLGCAGLARRVWLVPVLLFGFGVVVEVLQDMIGREFSWGDMAANGVGILLGMAAYSLACRYFAGRS